MYLLLFSWPINWGFNHLECIKWTNPFLNFTRQNMQHVKWISALVNCVVHDHILHGKRIFCIDHVVGAKEFEADSRTF
jgi:hypothetical protein